MAISSAQQIELSLLISADTQGAVQAANAFKTVGEGADEAQAKALRASETMMDAFGPRLITSLDGVRASVLATAQAMEQFARSGSTAISSKASAVAIRELAQEMQVLAVSGDITEKHLTAFEARLRSITATTPQAAAAQAAMVNQLQQLKVQTAGVGSGFTTMQTAGQAMTASFSSGQIAAGNFSAGIFGMGFAFLFAGEQFTKMNVKFLSMFGALTVLQVGLVLYQKTLGDAATMQQTASETAGEYAKALDDLRGEAALVGEELKGLFDDAIKFEIDIDDIKIRKVIEEMPGFMQESWEQIVEDAKAAGVEISVILEESINQRFGGGEGFFEKIQVDVFTSKMEAEFGEAWKQIGDDLSRELDEATKDRNMRIHIDLEIGEIDTFIEGQQGLLDESRDAISDWADQATDIISAGADDKVDAVREGLRNEIDAIREGGRAAIDVRRDALREELHVMQLAATEWVRLRNIALNEEIELIRDRASERLDAVETALESELAIINKFYDAALDSQKRANKDEIDEIKAKHKAIQHERSEALEDEINDIRDAAEDVISERRRQLRDELQAIARGAEDKISAIRAAFEEEKRLAKKAADGKIDAVRDALKDEIDIIKDHADDLVDARRDALDDELDLLRDVSDDRIKVIRKAFDEELEANRDRINALKDAERELEKELDKLIRRRQEIISLTLTTVAELDALKALGERVGFSDSLNREIALHEGKIKALEDENIAIDAQTGALAEEMEQLQTLIDLEKERTDAIKERREAAIDAIRDELKDALKAAKKRASAEIDAIKDVRDEAIDAARDRADAEIDGINDALQAHSKSIDKQIVNIRRAAQEAKDAATDVANEEITELGRVRDAEIEAARDVEYEEQLILEQQEADELATAKVIHDDKLEKIEEEKQAELDAAEEVAEEKKADIIEIRDEDIEATKEVAREARLEHDETVRLRKIGVNDVADEDIRAMQGATKEAATEAGKRATEAIRQIGIVEEERLEAVEAVKQARLDAIDDEEEKLKDVEDSLRRQLELHNEIEEVIASYTDKIALQPAGQSEQLIHQLAQQIADSFGISITEVFRLMIEAGIDVPGATSSRPNFHAGGVIGGIPGTEQTVRALGGEIIINPNKTTIATEVPIQGGITTINITVNAGSEHDMKKLERVFNKSLGSKAVTLGKMRRRA